jgi:arabinose-5-phosphate isomerase
MNEDIDSGREVLRNEAAAVAALADLLDSSFEKAVAAVLACPGQLIATGMGKSGLIAQKISATLASTGTPSIFLHPAEAMHGDLGRVGDRDVVLALSNSGEAEEIRRLVPALKRIGAPIIAMTGKRQSTLAKHADVVLWTGNLPEACPVRLAPTTSTTAQLALGDALAMTVAKRRNFTREDYAAYHPGGALGRSLLKVHEVLDEGRGAPTVKGKTTREALMEAGGMGRRPGCLAVTGPRGNLRGILTDGDVRRWLLKDPSFLDRPIDEVMTTDPKTIRRDQLAAEAWRLMRTNGFHELPVVDADGRYVGLLEIQDLLAVGFTERG